MKYSTVTGVRTDTLGGNVHWLARPHLFTLLFLAIFASKMRRLYRGDDVPAWQFGVIMLVWANIHGAFIFGFVILGAYLVAWLIENRNKFSFISPILQKLLTVGVVSFLVTFINPVGWRLRERVLDTFQANTLSTGQVNTAPSTFTLWVHFHSWICWY